jgi:hypothetical protein
MQNIINIMLLIHCYAVPYLRRLVAGFSPWWPGFHPRSCWIYDGRSGTENGFVQLHWFPLPILIPPTAPHSSCIIWGWYNRPNSGRCTKWTQSHPTQRIIKIALLCVHPLLRCLVCCSGLAVGMWVGTGWYFFQRDLNVNITAIINM